MEEYVVWRIWSCCMVSATTWMVDSSACGFPGSLVCGGVVHNSRGFVTTFFHAKVGDHFAFEAELIEVIYALELTHANSFNFIWQESDSMYVVTFLWHKSSDVPWHVKARWRWIYDYIVCIYLRVSHIFMEGICVVDFMATPKRE